MHTDVEAPPAPVGPVTHEARDGGQADSRVARRRFAVGSAAGIVAAGTVFAWMVTDGTFQFFRSLPFSDFYAVQARALLHGTWSMPANVLTIEGIRTAGRTDMYYGPVPALLRIPVLVLTHRLDGRLTQVSLLVAFVLCLVFVSMLSWRIRGMVRGQVAVTGLEAALTASFVVVVGLGSVLLFLGTTAQVYEEAELWGAALALGTFSVLLGFVQRPSAGRLVATGLLTTLALLTRGSVGAGPVVAVGLVAAVYLVAWAGTRSERWRVAARRVRRLCGVRVAASPGRFAIGLVAAALVPVVLYVVVNEVKFGTLVSIPLDRQVATLDYAHRRAVLAANGGSLFGLSFLPSNLLQYVRPDALSVSHLFPWIFFPGKALVLGGVLYTTRDWASSVPASMPLLAVLAVVGVVVVSSSRSARGARTGEPGVAAVRLLLVGAAAGTAGILVIAFVAERYLADVMPLLLLAAIPGWHTLLSRFSASRPDRSSASRPARWGPAMRAVMATLLGLLALFEVWTGLSLALFYQRELGPAVTLAERAGMVRLQQQILEHLTGRPTPDVLHVTALPVRAQPLDLAVVGHCAGVYQYDGNSWQPVEVGTAGGAFLLRVTFPRTERGRRQPLLVSGGARPQDLLAVTWEGGDRYRLSYRFGGKVLGAAAPPWYPGPVFDAAAGQPHQVRVDLLGALGQVYATVDGSPALSLLYPVAPPTHVRLGSAPADTSTTPTFAGTVRRLPVPTPICDQLERRR